MRALFRRIDGHASWCVLVVVVEQENRSLTLLVAAPITSPWSGMADEGVVEEVEAMDSSLLPPG